MVQTKVPVRLLGAPRAGLANGQATNIHQSDLEPRHGNYSLAGLIFTLV